MGLLVQRQSEHRDVGRCRLPQGSVCSSRSQFKKKKTPSDITHHNKRKAKEWTPSLFAPQHYNKLKTTLGRLLFLYCYNFMVWTFKSQQQQSCPIKPNVDISAVAFIPIFYVYYHSTYFCMNSGNMYLFRHTT